MKSVNHSKENSELFYIANKSTRRSDERPTWRKRVGNITF